MSKHVPYNEQSELERVLRGLFEVATRYIAMLDPDKKHIRSLAVILDNGEEICSVLGEHQLDNNFEARIITHLAREAYGVDLTAPNTDSLKQLLTHYMEMWSTN